MSDKSVVVTEGEIRLVKTTDILDKPWGRDAIKLDQDGIFADLGKLDRRIHINQVQCMMQAHKHGDTSLERRLIMDIVGEKTGYRRKGMIVHFRLFSPMELKADIINLSGVVTEAWQQTIHRLAPDMELPAVGEKRPWLLELAAANPFTSLVEATEVVLYKPVYKDTILGRIANAQKAFKEAVANTLVVNGQPPRPIDPKKAFYDGVHLDRMDQAFDKIEAILTKVESWKDSTKVVREAHAKAAEAERELAEATKS